MLPSVSCNLFDPIEIILHKEKLSLSQTNAIHSFALYFREVNYIKLSLEKIKIVISKFLSAFGIFTSRKK